ncbi:hypothetical protein JTE90_023636 [Oedothorax gibbosus]|uniref:Uncharacterized protein n=1 Tax=Oedothorax gibbosus TaxID=931172 RepID=A0AAV6TNU1_9ARAC|nr:hypothetical protein JTE90_023636 [Oedothorax gibbosus]
MTSIAEARNCLLKLEDRNVLNNLNYIVTESIEFTEDEPHNISALNKSELDIELEICEEILALDDGTSTDSNEQLFENIDLENIFDSPESVLEIHQGASINGSYQHENIKLECENIKLECGSEDIKLECGSEDIKLECSDAHESNVQSNVETCNDPAKQLFDNESSKVSEDEFDSEIKKCCDILKDEEPSNTYATDHLSQMPILAQFNNTTDSSHIFTEKEIKTEKIEASVAAEIIVKSENVTTDASVHLDQVLLLAQFTNTTNSLQILIEKEIKSENKEIPVPVEARSPVKLEDIPLPVSEESTEKMRKKRNCEESSDSISIVHESNGTKPKKLKSVIYVPNLNMEVKCEKDEDELSLFAETDISTVEEEYEVVEGSDSPQYSKEHSDSEQDDARSKKVSPRSVVVLPETDYLHAEREDSMIQVGSL